MILKTIFTFTLAIFLIASSCKSDAKETGTILKDEVVAAAESTINAQSGSEVIEESPKNPEATTVTKNQRVDIHTTKVDVKTPVTFEQPKEKVNGRPNSPPEKPSPSSSTTKPEKPTQKDEIDLEETTNTNTEKIEEKEESDKTEIPESNTKPERPVLYDVPVGSPNHKLFDVFLGAFVSNGGNVDYSGMKKKEADLDAYLTSLEKTKITTTWSRAEKLAYWINAYNAYTIKLILDNYPIEKITDLYGGKPWDHKWIKLAGKTLSLNNIENDIIRPDFKEPRIHFAVNCAAKSCPPLMNSAFTAKNLENQLERQTKKFVNNSQYNTLGKSEIALSKIFDWYGVDFGDVASFVAKYADKTVKPTAKVKFNEYNWALNGK